MKGFIYFVPELLVAELKTDRIFLSIQVVVQNDIFSVPAVFDLVLGHADIHSDGVNGTSFQLYKRSIVIAKFLESLKCIGKGFLTAFLLAL